MKKINSILLIVVLIINVNSLYSQERQTISSNPYIFHIPKKEVPEIKKEIKQQVQVKEQIIQDQLEEYLDKMLKNKQISNNLQTTVNVKVISEVLPSGIVEQNLHAKYNYEILGNPEDGIKSQIDDYPSGKYKLGSSNAAMSTMQIFKQTVENSLTEYLASGAKVSIKITGTTDASQIKGIIPYLDDFGTIEAFTYFLNNQISSVSIDKNNGISSNEQLGFLRTFGVRQFIETYIEPLKKTNTTFEHYVETTDKIGGKNRRVTIELVVHDAFKNIKTESLSKATTENVKPVINKIDVDINIPNSTIIKENTYALIIGNEDYSSEQSDLNSEVNVDYAVNDASIFKEYCLHTLGLKEEHIIYLKNATAAKMNRAIKKLEGISEILKNKMDIIVYYSGHGLPDEQTKEAYIMPVDVSGTDIKSAIKLNDLYVNLTKHSPNRVTVFLDACFSGGGRNKGLLSLKGVKIKAKEESLNGNLVVFTSSSGEESSTVYKDKHHGLFTYYLLKKLQETKGDVTYKDLSEYIIDKVKLESIVVNNKSQTPTISGSISVVNQWGNWKLK